MSFAFRRGSGLPNPLLPLDPIPIPIPLGIHGPWLACNGNADRWPSSSPSPSSSIPSTIEDKSTGRGGGSGAARERSMEGNRTTSFLVSSEGWICRFILEIVEYMESMMSVRMDWIGSWGDQDM